MTDLWWKSAVVYQIYPRSFADADGDGMGDLRGIIDHLDHLAGLGVDVLWLSPVYPSPQDDNGYDISDYQDIDPLFGDARRLRRAAGRRARPRHEADHGPGGEPQLRRAPVVRREPVGPDNPKRDWYWWRPARDGHEPGHARRRADQLGLGLRRVRPGSTTRRPASTTCTCSPASSPTSTGRTREVRDAVYAMMRWWLDRGVDGFRMDVINMISKDPALPDGRAAGRRRVRRRLAPCYMNGPRIHEFLHEMHDARCSPAATRC